MFDSSHRHHYNQFMTPNMAFFAGVVVGVVVCYFGYPLAIAYYCDITGKDLDELE